MPGVARRTRLTLVDGCPWRHLGADVKVNGASDSPACRPTIQIVTTNSSQVMIVWHVRSG